MPLSTSRKVSAALGAGFGLLLLVAGLAALGSWRTIEAGRWVSHSHEMRSALLAVRAGVSQAEAGLRARLVTDDPAALVEYRTGIRRWTAAFARVRALTQDDAAQRSRLDAVAALLAERRRHLERGLALADAGAADDAALDRGAQDGLALTSRVAAALDAVDEQERARLAARVAAASAAARLTTAAVVGLVVIAAVLGALVRRSVRDDLAARLRTEEALRTSEERLRALFEQTFQLTGFLAPDGAVLELNATALHALATTRDAVAGRPLAALAAWDDEARRALRAAIADAAGGAVVQVRVRSRGPGDAAAELDLSLTPLRAAGGAASLLLLEGRDVTEQLAAERALRASEATFAGILAIAADAIITVDAGQRILLFNHGAEEIFGHRAADVLGQPLDVLLPARVHDAHRRQVERFGTSGEAARRMGTRQTVFGRRRDGTEFPAEASISTLELEGRRLYTVVLRDVTEQAQLERRQRFLADAGELLASSLDLRSTIDHVARLAVPMLGDACIVDLHDGEGAGELAVAHVDPAREALARDLRRRFPPDPDGPHPLAVVRRTGQPLLLPAVEPPLVQAATTSEEHRAAAARLDARSALFVPLVARGHTLGVLSTYASARVLGADDLALAQELARRAALAIDNARAYDAARQASRARDQVLGIVSHDLRNPISAISMCARALDEGASPAEVREFATMIRRSTRWMEHIIRDLLDVTAIEAGRLTVEPEATSADAIVDAVLAMHAPVAEEQGVSLSVELAPDLPALHVDADRVVQAVGNLLGNAIKFTPRGGRVTLTVALADEAVAFRVADTGPGIPAEHLPHLFDRFWQARATRRGGAGLGLAIARGIAAAHGGRIEVASTVGAGSAFTLVLPLG